jgi:outer membrane immunogenic protein
MRRSAFFVLAAVAFDLGAVGNAFSGDLGRPPAYAPPPPPVYYGWSGCYAGLNAGGLWGHINGAADGSAGLTAGAQAGCNYQMNAFVFGGETDLQYTGLDGSHDELVGTTTIHEDFRSRWLATFRGRLGWLYNPTMLIYGTGGFAVANADATDSWGPGSVSDSTMHVGWTIGTGLEWMFAPQWSVKAEYLYVDLGHSTSTTPFSTIDHHPTENIVRVGVNYHF